MIWIVLGAVAVAIVVVAFVATRRRTPDGVVTFQRQIDALSPEARRPVVQRLEDVSRRSDARHDEVGDDEVGDVAERDQAAEERDVDGA